MNTILLGVGVVVAVGAVAGWLACGGWAAIGVRYEDDSTVASGIAEVRVIGGTVDVEVRPGSGPGVEIHRTARYLNPFHGRPGPTTRIDGDVLELGGDDTCTICKVEYVVLAPAGVRVRADIATGSLVLANVSTVDAKVSTGSVTIVDATGDVTAGVQTGSISGRGLGSGAVVATAATGSVSLELARPADVRASASVGSVDVTVPTAAYRIEAIQRIGQPRLGIANDPNGEHRLALSVETGQITLAAR